ncbi:putative proline--tRNA ligase, mitochondrial [Eufriesea mexicana]|uniref:proline--tRNA ligase n=1 Tax=Eufriesea mexicana TaxID=516756 RepID=A0A310SJG1_9HYME|nr:putative proline--tRNA ligase, mitochondrial [Eufriesea mexicana]
MYAMLPLGLRVLNKLTAIVDTEMERIGAQKLLLPALVPIHLWEETNRLNNITELFKIKDRSQKDYILGPTYEETICFMLSEAAKTISINVLPLKLYQISNKWRDEIKPRHGFLKSREFIMKDLYTFDINLISAQDTYASVCEAYTKIFNKIGIKSIKAIGNPGLIGGSVTHEYHYACNIGEDIVCVCSSCQHAINKSMCKETHCPYCKNAFHEEQTIEVGHAFLLDTKYTIPLNVTKQINNISTPLAMGCFGLGLTRIFTAISEILSTDKELRWPKNLAPYTVCVIPPKVIYFV